MWFQFHIDRSSLSYPISSSPSTRLGLFHGQRPISAEGLYHEWPLKILSKYQSAFQLKHLIDPRCPKAEVQAVLSLFTHVLLM